MERQLAGGPGDAQALESLARGIIADTGIGAIARLPGLEAGETTTIIVEAAAVEHDHARVIQGAQGRQEIDGMAKDSAVGGLVEQAPHGHAGVIAVAADHAEEGVIVAPGHLGRIAEAPTGIGFFVNHQADLVAQVELVAPGHAGDETDGVEAHELAVEQIATKKIRIVR